MSREPKESHERQRRGERERNGEDEWIKIQCREDADASKTTIFSAGGDGGWDVVVDMRPCGNCGLAWESGDDVDNIFVPHTHVFSNTRRITLSCVGTSDCACTYRIRSITKH